MRLELKEFAKAACSMHQQPGGIKRTRLMLHLRPYKTRRIFVLKATDGHTTLTTRVEHQGQIRLVEALVNDFVSECTRLSVPATGVATAGAGGASAQASLSQATGAVNTSSSAATGPASQRDNPAVSKAGQAGHTSSGQQNSQQQQQQQKSSRPGNKGKKGKKH